MNKINYKIIFLFLIALSLVLTGCSSSVEYNVIDFDLTDEGTNLYTKEYSNDTEQVYISEVVECENKKAKVEFYYDAEKTDLVTTDSVLIVEGDNLVYGTINFGNGTSVDIILNLYRLRMFTVSFKTDCKTGVEDQYVEENSCAIVPDVELTKAGYKFAGWDYKFSRPITSDTIINAQWKANAYTVTYDTTGGEVASPETLVTYGETYELETPTREGYVFLGWQYNGRFLSTERWLISEDITVTAVWEVETRTYEIEYIIVGAVGPNLQRTYTNKEEVVLRTPYKSGYKFMGWYFEGNFSGERVYKLPKGTEGNLTLYAKWQKYTLDNQKISFLGDSITTFYSSSSSINSLYSGENQFYYPIYSSTVKTVEKTWWYQVVQGTNTSFLVNDSWSGSSCYNNGNEYNQGAMNYNRINNLKGSDIVVILIGTNDNVNGHSQDNFTKAYSTMLKRIREVCPDAYIFCCTLGYASYNNYYYKEATRLAYNDIIRTVTVDYDAAVVELSEVQTEATYQSLLGDALHLNDYGMTVIANKVIETIKNYVGAI